MRSLRLNVPIVALLMSASTAAAGWGSSAYQYAFDPPPIVFATACGLAVSAADNVLLAGESTQVNAFAQFPDDAYAFAAAEFDVEADSPAWTYASDGVITDSGVMGIMASQANDPAGDPADPTNPLRIWSGVYAPASSDPQLVELTTTPQRFAYYPDERSRSSVDCEAAPGRDWLLVNPLRSGRALLAPAPGTSMAGAGLDILIANTGGDRLYGSGGDDILIGGRTTYDDGIQFGLLLPDGAPIRIVRQGPIVDLTYSAEVEPAEPENDDSPTEIIGLSFGQAPLSPTYAMKLDAPTADAVEVNLSAFAGQTVRIRFQAADAATAMLNVARIPDQYTVSVQPDPRNGQTRIVYRLDYDQPVSVLLLDGSVRTVRNMEVHAIQNNLHQLTLGVHRIAMGGVGKCAFQDLHCTTY